MKRFIVLTVLVSVFSSPLYSLGKTESEASSLQFSKKQYSVAVYNFSGRNLLAEYSSLSQGFPRLLFKQIESCREHQFGDNEQAMIRKIILDTAVTGFNTELESLYKQRDDLLFGQGWQGENYRDKTILIQKLENKIAAFENYPPDKIDLPPDLPVFFMKPSESEPLQPWKEGLFQPKLKLDDATADLAVYGTVEQVGDILYITVSVFNYLTGEARQIWRGTGRNEDISFLVNESAAALRTEILGHSWGGIEVHAMPDSSMLYIDGELFGIGEGKADALTPGKHQLTVAAEGYAPESREIVVPESEYSIIDVALEKTEGFMISVTSDPSGADVYTGSIWIGKTPLTLERPANGLQLIVMADGYNPVRTRIGPGFGESQIHVDLVEGLIDYRMVYEKKRREMYTSLGFFAVSILIPVVLSGLNSDYLAQTNLYAGQYNTEPNSRNKDLYDEAYMNFEVTRWCLYGSLALTGGLLVNVLVKLYHFLKAAEDSAP